MKNVYLLRSFAALAMGMILASCSSDDFEQQPTEAEAVTIAEEKLGFTFDPNQDWSMTQSGSIDVTVNAGIDANEVLILDALPYGDNESHILGHADVEEGQTVTVNYVAPKAIKYFYVACRNAQKNYRFVYAEVGATSASFANTTRAMASRRDGANVSVDEEGYNTFNSELALSWEGVIAAERTGTNGFTYFLFMGDFVPWKSSGWTDKFHQITAPVVDSDITDQEASDLSNLIKSVIPEGENNLAKAKYTGYSIVTTGGPVTLTPIFKNSNSGDRISYYYYPEGTTPTVEQIKAMKKYTIGEMADPQVCNTDNYSFYKKTYSLVYEAPDGSVSENFPKGLVINFIISNTWIGERQYKDIYASGGITTTSSGGTYSDDLIVRRALSAGDEMECGSWKWRYEQIETRFGRSDWFDQWNYNRGNAPANPYNNFAAATQKTFGDYTAYTVGNNVNGSLTDYGTTTYFLRLNNEYRDNLYAKVALSLNPGKGLYIYELDNDYNSTSGTIVGDYNGKTFSDKDILVEFPIKKEKVYALFAGGSKLGFYGWEVVTRTSSGDESTTTTTVSEVITKKIDTFQDYYGDGRMNVEVHQSGSWGFNDYSHGITDPQTPHSAVFEYGGRTFVGFEDWVDFDFNDVIYEIKGAEGGEEIVPGEPFIPIYSYAFEDTRYGDYDMNDVVLKVREDGDDIVLKLVATGAALDLNIRLYDNAGEDGMEYGSNFITLSYNDKIEVHEMLGVEHGYLTNTGADNNEGANAYPIEIRVPKANYADYRKLRLAIYIPTQQGKEDYEMRLAGSGQAPYGVIIPEDWKWPREFVNITIAYPEFKGFAETAGANEDWYKTPSENYVMDESDL